MSDQAPSNAAADQIAVDHEHANRVSFFALWVSLSLFLFVQIVLLIITTFSKIKTQSPCLYTDEVVPSTTETRYCFNPLSSTDFDRC